MNISTKDKIVGGIIITTSLLTALVTSIYVKDLFILLSGFCIIGFAFGLAIFLQT